MNYKKIEQIEKLIKELDCKSYELIIVDKDENEITLRKCVEVEHKIGFE